MQQAIGSRPQGRPPSSDAADIRQQIMDAAVELFSRRGYAATSVRQIADHVGVTAAMVHYYFGNKHSLLEEALRQSLEPLAAAVAEMREQGRAPPAEIMQLLLGVFADKPDLPVLMTREVLLPGGAMQQQFIEEFAPRLGGALPGLVAAEQAAGRLRKDADPALVSLALLALCVFPFISRGLSEPVLGVSFHRAGIRKLHEATVGLVERGLAP
jgi:AcrR family transcriptional regulator